MCCDDCCARVAHCYFSSVLPALLLLLLFVNHLFCGAGGGAQMAAFQLELDPAGHLDTRTRIDREVPPLFHIPLLLLLLLLLLLSCFDGDAPRSRALTSIPPSPPFLLSSSKINEASPRPVRRSIIQYVTGFPDDRPPLKSAAHQIQYE